MGEEDPGEVTTDGKVRCQIEMREKSPCAWTAPFPRRPLRRSRARRCYRPGPAQQHYPLPAGALPYGACLKQSSPAQPFSPAQLSPLPFGAAPYVADIDALHVYTVPLSKYLYCTNAPLHAPHVKNLRTQSSTVLSNACI